MLEKDSVPSRSVVWYSVSTIQFTIRHHTHSSEVHSVAVANTILDVHVTAWCCGQRRRNRDRWSWTAAEWTAVHRFCREITQTT